MAVIGVTAAVTVSVVDKRSEGGSTTARTSPSTSASAHSDIASANDTGPVAVILEDPSCATQYPVISAYISRTKTGWEKRNPELPAIEWTPQVRAQHESAGQAFRDAADQLIPSAKLTPHRVMRELYEQFIAYGRAYAESIPTYTPINNNLAGVAARAADAIDRICAAIGYGSAAARGPLVPALPEPAALAPVQAPADAQKLLFEPNPVCPQWNSAMDQFLVNSQNWNSIDPDIPGVEWSPEQRKINDEVVPVMRLFNTELSALGRQSGNPTLRDFADLASQYLKAYLEALPTYTPADNYLAIAATRTAHIVQFACKALG
ncbi:hypothetical protein [Mycobacterium sp. URHD0025]|uniref:hypothetical protein n=1 Tax=Mycobacterium sp. URHD0025 TaxID=1298864 RepID=UPI0018CAA17A|nr:hypothetical protein [Mycobacterium sp. URHD0025]